MDHVAVTVLCGGFGAARFAAGLAPLCDGRAAGRRVALTCVVNVGDDFDHLGLRVCPDLDSVLYALGGAFDEDKGWGPAGDSLACNDALRRYGDAWFAIGDRDFAVHLKRSQWLREGVTLTGAMDRLARAWDLAAALLPASDDPIHTMIRSGPEWLEFQDYLVRRRGAPEVDEVRYEGVAEARPAPGVIAAIETADLVVLAPSNPVSSIGVILAVPGVREALRARPAPTIAVTPVVRGIEPSRPPEAGRAKVRAALMSALGHPHRASAVAALYADFATGFVLDTRDAPERPAIESLGLTVLATDTLAAPSDRPAFATQTIEFGLSLTPANRATTPSGPG